MKRRRGEDTVLKQVREGAVRPVSGIDVTRPPMGPRRSLQSKRATVILARF